MFANSTLTTRRNAMQVMPKITCGRRYPNSGVPIIPWSRSCSPVTWDTCRNAMFQTNVTTVQRDGSRNGYLEFSQCGICEMVVVGSLVPLVVVVASMQDFSSNGDSRVGRAPTNETLLLLIFLRTTNRPTSVAIPGSLDYTDRGDDTRESR